MMASAKRVSREAFEDLCRLIQHWNENRLELFEISLPNENLEFEGIMRFYFQDDGTGSEKVATKCIRVSNTASTETVINALIQKFRPDLRMLTGPASYALYEVHSNQEEQKLDTNEYPLLVQLRWSRNDRDGRFLLRSEAAALASSTKAEKKSQNKRHLRRGKKSKKREKEQNIIVGGNDEEDGGNETGHIARSLYNIMPESRFTRSISIKNRRNLLVRNSPDKILRSMSSEESSANELKVYADLILPDVPSKSLLVSSKDTAAQVVKSALEKYGIHEDHTQFCIVQVSVPLSFNRGSEPLLNVDYNEHILGDNEYPYQLHSDWTGGGGVNSSTKVQLQLRRRSSFLHSFQDSNSRSRSPEDDPSIPVLVEIFQGAQSPPQSPRRFELSLESTEIGSNVALLDPKSYICLTSGGIKPRHCVISSERGFFTISPLDKTSLICVNGKFIKEPAFLLHNAEIKLGEREMFRFFAPVENKLFTSSMHTLPSNIGRPNSSRGMTSPLRHNQKSTLPHSENISKAYSVEDICTPGHNSSRMTGMEGRLKDRAFSEHNLKIDDRSSSGYGSGCVQRKFSEPNVMSEKPYFGGGKSKHGGSDSHFSTFPSSNKKRYRLSPAQEDKGHCEDSPDREWALPASLTFYQAQENVLLQNMISEVNGYLLSFKLAPACSLYMVVKHHLSAEFQPSPASNLERRKGLLLTIKNIIFQFKKIIKESKMIAGALAFWMANSSEFLYFLRSDYQLSAYLHDCETPLVQVIHTAYKYFTSCMLRELSLFLSAFCDESLEADSEDGYLSGGENVMLASTGNEADIGRPPISRQTSMTGMYWSVAGSKVRRRGRPTIGDVLTTLSSTISLLKRCRVNATLSIMIFSLLFRYISTKLFNKLVMDGKLCTQAVGQKLSRRLDRVKDWAEKEGMELPAGDQLCMIVQAATLLQSINKHPEDAQTIWATCSKLNSLQIRTLIHHCSISDLGQTINEGFAEQLVMLAQAHVDSKYHSDGIELNLEENANLELQFLVPSQGYASDVVVGIPPGLHEYLDPMISSGLCKLIINNDDNLTGQWVPSVRESITSPPVYSGSTSNITEGQTTFTSPHHSRTNCPAGDLAYQTALKNRVLAKAPASFQDISVVRISIQKDQKSLGLSIIGTKNTPVHGDLRGIFVKSMMEGGAAHRDGRIHSGDQILEVDNFNLNGCTQEEAAHILRATGNVVNLTLAKQTAGLYGMTHLINQPSPRYNRKMDWPTEGVSNSRKPLKKRQEQRERSNYERQEMQQREFRLERRKPPLDHHAPRGKDSAQSHFKPLQNTESRFPAHNSPQFTKWIMEQNPSYYYDMGRPSGSEIDISSMSSLPNIPEHDHPSDSPELSFVESSSRYHYDSSDRGYHRPSTPPVRDPSPSKPTDHHAQSYGKIEKPGSSIALDLHTTSEGSSKFTEPDQLFLSTCMSRVPSSAGPYKDTFSSLSSQMTMESQQVLTPISQQLTSPSQQQQLQHLDKLSMDVMQHTQLSGTSFQGITSLIPGLSTKQQTGSKAGEPQLNHKGLKEFEMDDIDLEKQRIQLMFYEQQRQKDQQADIPLAQSAKADLQLLSNDSESPEDQDQLLPTSQLRQELESLEEMITAQRKKYREIKFSREREELKIKSIDMQYSSFLLNPNDQNRRQALRELDRVKKEKNETIHNIQYSERRAKTKLKAYEAQAIEIRQQLSQNLKASSPPNVGMKTNYDNYDVPSKLTSEYIKKRQNNSNAHFDSESDVSKSPTERNNPHLSAANWKWNDATTDGYNAPAPSRVLSVECMSAADLFEQPDLAREPISTISTSCLTEPTQDEPRNLLSYTSSARPPPPSNSFSTDSRVVLDTEQEDTVQSEHGGKPSRLYDNYSSLPGNNTLAGENTVSALTKDGNGDQRSDAPTHRGVFSNRHPRQLGSGVQSEGTSNPIKTPKYTVPEWNEPKLTTAYDVPTNARNVHQQTVFTHIQPTGRHHYSRNTRSRGVQYTKVYIQPTGNVDISKHAKQLDEPPKTDIPEVSHPTISVTTAPDIVPRSYSSSVATSHAPSGPRFVTGSERIHSPVPHPAFSVPSDPHYAVPPSRNNLDKSYLSSHSPSPTPQIPAGVNLKQDTTSSLKPNLQHIQAGSKVTADSPHDSSSHPNTYDQPSKLLKNHHGAGRAVVGSSKPTVVYDVPTAALGRITVRPTDTVDNHIQTPSPVCHGPAQIQEMSSNVSVSSKPRPSSASHGHRYGVGKPSIGHSYSRGRPDTIQQALGLDKVKGFMDRTYKNQTVRHPEQVQRQQTEL